MRTAASASVLTLLRDDDDDTAAVADDADGFDLVLALAAAASRFGAIALKALTSPETQQQQNSDHYDVTDRAI